MAAQRSGSGFFAPFLARPRALLALWALPALAMALLTSLAPAPGAAFVDRTPDPAETVAAVLGLVVQLWPELFLLAAFAAPTARLLAGAPLREAARALGQPAVLGAAAAMALLLTFALLLTMLPGLMALYVSPLMGTIFLSVGTVGGAAAAVGLFARWMYAPALAAERGLEASMALDASRAAARAEHNFGAALGLAVLFALVLGASALAGLAGQGSAGLAGRVLGTWLVLWPGTALVEANVAARWRALDAGAVAPPGAPALARSRRPSRCPRCGALAQVKVAAPTDVRCAGCGLQATVG